jgi:hypothetical protein
MHIKDGIRFNVNTLRNKRSPSGELRKDYPNENDLAELGITYIPDPIIPEGISSLTHYITEQDAAPYIAYTEKNLDDRLEVKEDGSPLYVQVWNPVTELMEDTAEQVVSRGLKYGKIQEIKKQAGQILAESDWKVVRESEGIKPCDQITKDFRAAVRAYSDSVEAAITACTTHAEFAAAVAAIKWPESD